MVKISLVSGFLGSGKTTLIKKLLKEEYFGKNPYLIENDYGAVNLDDQLKRDVGVQVIDMSSGCICCSLVENFLVELEELIRMRQPEHIIIEPSSVSKLSELQNVFCMLKIPYEIYTTVTVADAKRFAQNQYVAEEYFWDQIKSADAVVLSKVENMSKEKLSSICRQIQEKIGDRKIICEPWDTSYAPLLKKACRPVSCEANVSARRRMLPRGRMRFKGA